MPAQFPEPAERRRCERVPVLVPSTVGSGESRQRAHLLNLSAYGALIQTTAPLRLHSRLTFRCGTVAATASVLWRDDENYGLAFAYPLTEAEIVEQVARTAALHARLEVRSNRRRDGQPGHPAAGP
jgi:hypothetical protein